MSNTLNVDKQISGKSETLFQKSANLNLHLDKFAITNQNNKIGKKSKNTREFNNLKENLKVLMDFENSVRIINKDGIQKKSITRDKTKENDINRQFKDLTLIIEAKYKGCVGIEKTKSGKIKFLNKQPKSKNENSDYIFLDTLKNDLKNVNEELHNLKRTLKQVDQYEQNKETFESIKFQQHLIQLLDIKKVNTKAQKEKFYEKAYDTLISFQEQNFKFRINERDLSKQTYNFVSHKIKETNVKLTNGNEIKTSVEKLYRALDFNSKHTKEEVVQSFKDDHLFNEEYMSDKSKDVLSVIHNKKYDFKHNLENELKQLKNDINDSVDLKSWSNKTIENRGVSKDLAKDFKHKLNSDSYKDFTNNHIDILNQDLDKKIIEFSKEKKYDEIDKIANIKENLFNKDNTFKHRMKNYYSELNKVNKKDKDIEIVFEVDEKEVSKEEFINKVESINIVDNSNNFVNEYLKDFEEIEEKIEEKIEKIEEIEVKELVKEDTKEVEELVKEDIKEVEEIKKINIDKSKVIEDIKEIKLKEENKSIAILNKLGALIDTTKTKDFTIEWQQKVEKIGLINYAKNLRIRLSKNHNFNKSMTIKENDIDYVDFKKSSEKELDKLDINNDIESFEYKNNDNSIDTFETKNLDRYSNNDKDITRNNHKH